MVGSWLFCIQKSPCSVSFWSMLGVNVEVWTKNILYQFIEGGGGQNHISTSWHDKMSWTLYELIYSSLHIDSMQAPKTY